ncbi:hypothetical protein EDD85DRAFT_962802 [Armillaria nabsnona]|nr:hypothetical protein EDD85DRAFT_962802 [Armillaria nabsnona]
MTLASTDLAVSEEVNTTLLVHEDVNLQDVPSDRASSVWVFSSTPSPAQVSTACMIPDIVAQLLTKGPPGSHGDVSKPVTRSLPSSSLSLQETITQSVTRVSTSSQDTVLSIPSTVVQIVNVARDSSTDDNTAPDNNPPSPASSTSYVEHILTEKIAQLAGAGHQIFEELMMDMGWTKRETELFSSTVKSLARQKLIFAISVTEQLLESNKHVCDLTIEKFPELLHPFGGASEPNQDIEWPIWQVLICSCKLSAAKEKREDDKSMVAKARQVIGRR